MKRAALAIALLATGAASAVQMASQPWVTNRITQATAATLQSAKDYTDAAIAGAGGLTPEMVTNIVQDVAPAPGDYAAVSNAAMSAVQPGELAAATNGIPRITESGLGPGIAQQAEYAIDATFAGQAQFAEASGSATSLKDSEYHYHDADAVLAQLDAATSTNAAQTAALAGKASTNDVQLAPVYGGDGERFGEWVIEPPIQDAVISWADNGWELNFTTYTVFIGGDESSVSIEFEYDTYPFTATRTENPILGYVLGSQTNKVLASTNDLARASDLAAVRSVAYAATATNAAQTAEISSLSTSLAPIPGQLAAVAQSATNYTDSAIADADTSYRRVSFLTNLNQSVQYVSVSAAAPTTLTIDLPDGANTADWIVYVTSVTNVTLSLPSATWYMADEAYTNDIPPATPTALYFTQMADGLYMLGRQELKPITIGR